MTSSYQSNHFDTTDKHALHRYFGPIVGVLQANDS